MGFALKVSVLLVATCITYVIGHGAMMDPVGRQSRWRLDKTAPPNYNDNELFCGGLGIMQGNNGRCGLCGDSFTAPTPRPHEIGGLFGGTGTIVGKYRRGSAMPISVKLSANHKGYFEFEICNLDNQNESENCFAQNRIRISDGNDRYYLPTYDPTTFNLNVILPDHLVCNHCVVRWTYTAANNWGICSDGTGAQGCGPQEVFKNCADITIYN